MTAEERERHFSNLAFFQTFADLRTDAQDILARLRDSHVLLLGVGGLGSNVLQNLAGLGVGRLTLVDRYRVDPRNFARQFVYRARDVGRSKVDRAAEWVAEFDPSIKVDTVETDVAGAADVADLLGSVRPDAVSSGADSPREVDLWVNEACVRAGCRSAAPACSSPRRSFCPYGPASRPAWPATSAKAARSGSWPGTGPPGSTVRLCRGRTGAPARSRPSRQLRRV